MVRKVNAAGVALVKEFEGRELAAYRCPAGHWTIGWGHTAMAGPPEVHEGDRITAAKAESILNADLKRFGAEVEQLVTVPLSDNQFAALVSFVYNLGPEKLAGSTALKRLNKRDYDGAAAALEWWNKARDPDTGRLVVLKGLKRRRAAEKALYLTPDEAPAPAEVETNPDAIEVPTTERRDSPLSGRTGAGVGLVSGGAAVQSDQAQELVDQGSILAGVLPWAGGVLIALGVGWILWARYSDWRRARKA